MNRVLRSWCVAVVGSALVWSALAGCSSEAESYGGFDSATECARGTAFAADGDVTAQELVDKCDVSLTAAEAALEALSGDDTEGATSTTTSTTSSTTSSPTSTTAAPAPTEPPTSSTMPAIPCGTDLQVAQDRVQEAGVFLSLSEDATGQGRNQVIDSNWTVVRQSPPPGTPIEEGDPVFYVVKDEEFSGC